MALSRSRRSRESAGWAVRGLRLTRAGWLAALLMLVLLAAGVNSGVNTLFLMSGIVCGALVVSGVGAWRQLTGLAVRRHLPTHVHAGAVFSVELDLFNRKRRAAYAVLLEDLVRPASEPWTAFTPRVAGGAAKTLRYSARVLRRGVVFFEGVRLATDFPLGLVRAWVRLARGVEEELVVYPALGAVRPSFLQGQLGGIRERPSLQPSRAGATDIHGLREYRPGDNPRWIHWRSSARLGKPVVKEFDREEARRIHVVVDAALPRGAGAAERQRLEWAVSFAGSLAASGVRAARMTGLTALGARRAEVAPASGVGHVRAVFEALARLTLAEEPAPLVPAFGRESLRNTAVILVVAWPERLRDLSVEAWQAPGSTVRVVDASAPAFEDLFIPPAVLGGPGPAEPPHRASASGG